MPKPNIFISHRWAYHVDYNNLVSKFDEYGFVHLNYSVPEMTSWMYTGPD